MPQANSSNPVRRLPVSVAIMMKADNREAVVSIIAKDPFHLNGIADYRIVEFIPTLFLSEGITLFSI